jgi:3-hydroxyisobutyrate dehydrogenase-like beta-hydroxyacid dehydrogenase
MKLAFIGTGTMGGGMARNLVRGGADLTVIARRPAVRDAFAALGCPVFAENGAAAACDAVFLCLPDEAAVEKVLFGEGGVLSESSHADKETAPAGRPRIIVDCSTISYGKAREFAARCAALGTAYLDAPVSGHQAKAEAGTLTVMAGGEESVFEEVRPYLEMTGSQILYMGPSGSGQLTKMINNCALNICTASFCELMPVGVKLGLDPEKLGKVLTTATGSSYASKTLIPEVLEGNFAHGFTLERAYKDMKSMLEVCEELSVPLPTFLGCLETYRRALETGRGDLYKGAMICFYEDLLDVKCRRQRS